MVVWLDRIRSDDLMNRFKLSKSFEILSNWSFSCCSVWLKSARKSGISSCRVVSCLVKLPGIFTRDDVVVFEFAYNPEADERGGRAIVFEIVQVKRQVGLIQQIGFRRVQS